MNAFDVIFNDHLATQDTRTHLVPKVLEAVLADSTRRNQRARSTKRREQALRCVRVIWSDGAQVLSTSLQYLALNTHEKVFQGAGEYAFCDALSETSVVSAFFKPLEKARLAWPSQLHIVVPPSNPGGFHRTNPVEIHNSFVQHAVLEPLVLCKLKSHLQRARSKTLVKYTWTVIHLTFRSSISRLDVRDIHVIKISKRLHVVLHDEAESVRMSCKHAKPESIDKRHKGPSCIEKRLLELSAAWLAEGVIVHREGRR
mmetsp:Transcript_9127/g.19332  ORF Transcript_9127/g.19332 Transcript_9127/m.19332 type:complete len:257 (-) Transcript_9127:234-1004(-)